ncbi:MAG: DUF4398 domain-containing protein [Acidobacteria bacterium]|nr:DUF4398 domain-containing protein [Acidobacteriota bacterium]
MPRTSRVLGILALVISFTACGAPPSKEMNQAQGAIDSARAAGADRYAAAELSAAVDSLQRSELAVTQNDYRLALSLAFESRERAQAAAKAAGENRAKARGDAERVVAEGNAQLTRARERLSEPEVARLPRRVLAGARADIDAAAKSLQEARAALAADDYPSAITLTNTLDARIQAAMSALEPAAALDVARKRR